MLMNLHKKGWTEGLKLTDFEKHHEASEKAVSVRPPCLLPFSSPSVAYRFSARQEMLKLATSYTKSLAEESTMTLEQLKNRHVGKQDPKRHLQDAVERAMGEQVAQSLGMGVLAEVSTAVRLVRGVAPDFWRF